ncbi:rhamnulokinase [Clostridium algidicarnis]|uniref:rhamnulokinase n=1 Tax=Clostridium algidicarnis TaxID=37659 RepID=UPI001C0AB855|nr:rhamnulokinase family protein [Clostridium algidicarnis]MBU3196667.1 rhamnulokinase [Clostridium algidicarnis]
MLKNVLAFDLGASSGRGILGSFDGNKIKLKEIHRFENTPITKGNRMYWDLEKLFSEIKKAMKIGEAEGGYDSIGIDTWGVDYGLIDKSGSLLGNPAHYRDTRTIGIIDSVSQNITMDKLYTLTGNQIMEINTLFQLYYEYSKEEKIIDNATTILMMPDLFNYLLTGITKSENTIASTTQIFDPYNKKWNQYIINKLGFNKDIFPEIISSGTEIGTIKDELIEELQINIKTVIAVCGHDTASAVVAVPSKKPFIFISCGTWSLLGTELKEPLINEKSMKYNITNETGVDGTTTFLKNIRGLWLIQETKRYFERKGKSYSYSDIEKIAYEADEFTCFIDVDSDEFQVSGDIPLKIQNYAKSTGQYIPKTHGEIFRCIYESLAFKYRYTYEQISECIKEEYKLIHMVGGGIKSKLLCQMTAEALGLEVIAGPIEATAIGNIVVQLIAQGEIKNLQEGRNIVRESFEIDKYIPCKSKIWNDNYIKYKSIIEKVEDKL